MKILHYSLGFPPYRTGGLTKFCMDIMLEQKQKGHEVSLLWPGEIKIFKKEVSIKYRGVCQDIENWENINPLPISYDEGVIDIESFTVPCDKSVFIGFLRECSPDIVHIHTLMGLHKEFIEALNELRIKSVFSVHDFFTICPKVTMFRKNKVCEYVDTCAECPQCNLTALSRSKITILQSPIYRKLKDSTISKSLRKKHRDQYLSGNASEVAEGRKESSRSAVDYKVLRSYYGRMISQIDVVHYNSSVTKAVFERFFSPIASKVISISHKDIADQRRIKAFGHELRLTYLGPQGGAKGFFCSRRLSMICG